MISVILLSTALAAPPLEASVSFQTNAEAVSGEATSNAPINWEQLQRDYLAALKSSAKSANPDMPEVVPVLVEVYQGLEQVEGISHHERTRRLGVVKARLEEFRNQLIRQVLRDKKIADRRQRDSQRIRQSAGVNEKANLLAGGGRIAQAIQLIDLIQTTIQPESWQVVGGKGSIYYFDLLQVLVVRQTGEVHHQLGGLLGQLKP